MKKNYLLLIMVFVCLFMGSNSRGQLDSQTKVIKQYVALQELQKKIPNEIKQNNIHLLILNQKVNIILA